MLQAAALMQQGQLCDLTSAIALAAAKASIERIEGVRYAARR